MYKHVLVIMHVTSGHPKIMSYNYLIPSHCQSWALIFAKMDKIISNDGDRKESNVGKTLYN